MSDVVSLRAAAETARSKHWCSFCGAGESKVALLVVSEDSRAAICDRCAQKSVAAMFERFAAMADAKGGRS